MDIDVAVGGLAVGEGVFVGVWLGDGVEVGADVGAFVGVGEVEAVCVGAGVGVDWGFWVKFAVTVWSEAMVTAIVEPVLPLLQPPKFQPTALVACRLTTVL